MDASKSKHLLRDASSGPPLITTSATVIGVVILLTASQGFAQSASEQTTNIGRTIQPQVYDFTWKNRQKAETKKLLQDARDAATQGQTQKARGLVRQAAELPMNWDLDEAPPQSLPHSPDDWPSSADVRKSGRRLVDIPTVDELAEPFPDDEAQTGNRESFKRQSQRKNSVGHSADMQSDDQTSPQQRRSANRSSQAQDIANEESNSPISAGQQSEVGQANSDRGHNGDVRHATSSVPSGADVLGRESIATTSLGPSASKPAANAEQALVNYSIIILSALFGAVVVLIGLLLFLLKKFGPNPTFVFKVEMTNTGRDAVSDERPAPPPLRIAPIYAMKMQEEAEREQQQEEAMMRKVFEDNLELRDQLKATRNAA